MNIGQIIATLVLTNIAFFATAQGSTKYIFKGTDNSLDTRICVAAASDNLRGLRQESRRDILGIKGVTRSLKCNHQDITHFAASYDAYKTTRYLSRNAPKKYRVKVDEMEITDLASHSYSVQVIYVSSK